MVFKGNRGHRILGFVNGIEVWGVGGGGGRGGGRGGGGEGVMKRENRSNGERRTGVIYVFKKLKETNGKHTKETMELSKDINVSSLA